MDKRFLAIIGVIILAFIAFLVFHQGNSSAPGNSGNGTPTNHIEGKGTSGVKLVEYGDFECPICADYYPTVEQVNQKYDSQIFFQFRNLPLVQIHQNAFAGARAAEAAGQQGKFWQMYNLLYQNSHYSTQSGWVVSSNPLDDYFVGYAKQIGLNVAKFKTDFASTQVNNSINADINAFKQTANDKQNKQFKLQEATPTFFLDGVYVPNTELIDSNGNPSVQAFSKVIDAAIAKQAKQKTTAQPAATTPAKQ